MYWKGQPIPRRRALAITGGLAGVSILGSPGVGEAQADNEIVVVVNGGAFEKFVRGTIFPEFEKRTGGKVIAVAGLTMQALAKLRASPDNPTLDVIRMDPPGTVPASREGLLHHLDASRIPNMKDLFDWAIPKSGDYVCDNSDYQTLAFNTKFVKTAPDSWLELWQPDYKGKVIIPDITTSHGVLFIAMLSRVLTGDFFNSDAAFGKLAELKPNVQTYWTGHDQVNQLLISGQAWLTPWISDRAVYQVSAGAPVDLTVPKRDGALFVPANAMISKNTKRLALAEAYINVLLDPKVQAENAEAILNGPSNRLAPLTGLAKKYYTIAELNLLSMDWDKLLQVQSGWTDRWNRQMVQ
jgi:putative spermidine/putrescine transport system substrate-binding protein